MVYLKRLEPNFSTCTPSYSYKFHIVAFLGISYLKKMATMSQNGIKTLQINIKFNNFTWAVVLVNIWSDNELENRKINKQKA